MKYAFLTAFALFVFLLPLSSHAADLSIAGGVYTNNPNPVLSWNAVDGAVHYDYKLNNNNYIGVGKGTSLKLGPLHDGWYTVAVRYQDKTGNSFPVSKITFEVDTTGPTIPAFTPSVATVLTPVTLKTTPVGDAWVSGCTMTVDGLSVGAMTEHDGVFSKSVTFTTTGKHKAAATCNDGDKNTTVGSPTTIIVSASPFAAQGDVIKTSCTNDIGMGDACHSIYYYGDDGMRHAFPNESVYMSWFDDYSPVHSVSNTFLTSLPVGKNVTYRPGSVLVQFRSGSAVYAVDTHAQLRHYISEALAMFDYGTAWSSLLVTVPDVLRNNYTIGGDIEDADDYDPATAWSMMGGIAKLFAR